MTVKKNSKLDLEKRRKAFFQIGLLFVVSVTLVAFEWDSFNVKNLAKLERQAIEEELIVEEVEVEKEEVVEIDIPVPEVEQVVQPVFDPLTAEASDDVIEPQTGASIIPIDLKPTGNIGGNGSGIGSGTDDTEDFHLVVGVMPEFQNGELLSYIKKHVVYSQLAVDLGAEGRVYVEFVVMKNGKVKNVKVVKSDDKLLNESAIEVIKNLPDFKPGLQRGRPVNVIMTVPINYRLG